MGTQPTSRGNHHIECPLYGRTSYPITVVCMCDRIDEAIEREIGDKIMTKIVENCVCGSVHEGDNWTIREWRDEHNAAHAERVIAMQTVPPNYGYHYGGNNPSVGTMNCGMSPFDRDTGTRPTEYL